VALLRFLVAALVQDFIKMTNLTSAACVTWRFLAGAVWMFMDVLVMAKMLVECGKTSAF